jgi:hypothetical protein
MSDKRSSRNDRRINTQEKLSHLASSHRHPSSLELTMYPIFDSPFEKVKTLTSALESSGHHPHGIEILGDSIGSEWDSYLN